jgi:hypothetical protein
MYRLQNISPIKCIGGQNLLSTNHISDIMYRLQNISMDTYRQTKHMDRQNVSADKMYRRTKRIDFKTYQQVRKLLNHVYNVLSFFKIKIPIFFVHRYLLMGTFYSTATYDFYIITILIFLI